MAVVLMQIGWEKEDHDDDDDNDDDDDIYENDNDDGKKKYYVDDGRLCKTQAHVYHLSVQRVTDLTSNRVGLNSAHFCVMFFGMMRTVV